MDINFIYDMYLGIMRHEYIGDNMEEKEDPTEAVREKIRARYIPLLAPLFLSIDPSEQDILPYFASLLRIIGMEDKGWDPYLESRLVLEDLNHLMQIDLPKNLFPDKYLTTWRLGLMFYTHIIEMDAPYEVLANLLRYKIGRGYSPNPFFDFLTDRQKRRYKNTGLFPKQKIEIIKQLSKELGIDTGSIFDEFYRADLRNAINHSDFILSDEGFRCRNGNGFKSFSITFEELDKLATKAKVFIGTFFGLETEARRHWGTFAGKGIPYDLPYKGIMEILVDDEGLMNGFKVHWPNNSESVYRRKQDGIDMINCMLDIDAATISLMVGRFAQRKSRFSPLVEEGDMPVYTPLEGSDEELKWIHPEENQ